MRTSSRERQRIERIAAKEFTTDPTVYWATNRTRKTATVLNGFGSWDEVQAAFQFGFMMPDGHKADGIGQCADLAEFIRRAKVGNIVVL